MGSWMAVVGAVLTLVAALGGCDEKSAQHAEKAKVAAKEAASQAGAAIKEGAKAAGESVKEAASKTGEAVGAAVEKSGAALKEKSEKLSEPKSEPAKSSGDALANAHETMNGYLDSLTHGSNLLESVKTPLDATTKSSDIKNTVSSISAKAGELLKLSPDQQTSLKNEFNAALKSAVDSFKAQIDRISKSSELGSTLGDLLKNVKLFE